ncbi:MAG TPA: hypothetical protein VE442_22115 [Jatrophihabitans sp.]|jgi:hypothetical protein|nr:hypothetical protein [Jatrophihabitans sp.]
MNRRGKQLTALAGTVVLATLAWPGPSSADTTLGGYSGSAQAEAIRIQIYEPVIPIPATPQVDAGIAYTKCTTDTGPVTRATASYLWPGDVIGDGFGQLVGNDAATYPVQVNSKYPATESAPAHNTGQLTKGNGMTTSSNGFTTDATTTGLGVAGPDTDLLSGIGDGLSKILGGKKSSKPLPAAPVPVGQLLAGLATVENVKSTSSVVVGSKSVTSTAQTYVSQVKLLAGLITIDSMKVTSVTTSDGNKATTTGSIKAGDVQLAGLDLGIGDDGVTLGSGSGTTLPQLPSDVTKLLDKIGISIKFAPSTRTVDGATGSLASTALEFSIDTVPLKTALNVGGLVKPLQDLIQQIPKLGSQIAPLLGLGPKIVIRIADVASSATAAPAYTGGLPPPPGGGNPGGNHTGHQPGAGGGVPGNVGGGGAPLNPGTGQLPGSNQTVPGGSSPPATQPTAFALPPLGTIPKLVILGTLAFALAGGWLFWGAGRFILGAGKSCAFGLSTGVPDLRKG